MFPFQDSSSESNTRPSITVTIDNLTIALLVASILYSVLMVMAKRKLEGMHRVDPTLTPKKLLLMSVAVVCAVRIMTILGVAGMNIANVRAHYSLQPANNSHNNHHHHNDYQDEDDEFQAFYDRAMTVLFDLPNCVVVSTYVLLVLVWAECFSTSRFAPTDNPPRLGKRQWWKLYTIFNACLYSCQLLLYASIFIATDSILRTILYAAITCINFFAVCLVFWLYMYVSISHSGYPPRSPEIQASLRKITHVIQFWTATRLLWGMATLVVYWQNIELLQDSNTPLWSFVVLVLLLFGCEILPMIAMLDYSYMNMIMFGMMMHNTEQQQQHNRNTAPPPTFVETGESFFLSVPLLEEDRHHRHHHHQNHHVDQRTFDDEVATRAPPSPNCQDDSQ